MPKTRSRAICTIQIAESADLSKLERARVIVSKLKGIVTLEADHVLQILTIEYDHETITLEEIRNAIKRV
jgi:hypothetical protein